MELSEIMRTQHACRYFRPDPLPDEVSREPEVKQILGIPESFSTACHIVAGYPEKPFPCKLRRLAVEEIAFVDTFGEPLRISEEAELSV